MAIPDDLLQLPPLPDSIRCPPPTPADLTKPPLSIVGALLNMFTRDDCSPGKVRLITIGKSHYCEKARWALDLAPCSFEEDPHAGGYHIFFTKPVSGQTGAPTVVFPDGRVVYDSMAINMELAKRYPKEMAWLYPEGLADDVQKMEKFLGDELGPLVRQMVYAYLLHDPPSLEHAPQHMVKYNSAFERKVFKGLLFPKVVENLRSALHIETQDGLPDMHARLEDIFDRLERLMSDGRKYLVGNTFTAADLTLGALSYFMWDIPELAHVFAPPLSELNPTMFQACKKYAERPIGKFVIGLYRQHRIPSGMGGGGSEGQALLDPAAQASRKVIPKISARDRTQGYILCLSFIVLILLAITFVALGASGAL